VAEMSVVRCIKYNKDLPKLVNKPIENDLGEFILNNISKQAWEEWSEEQIKFINENTLQLFKKEDRDKLYAAMNKFFDNKLPVGK
jgi:Fe-S cluster biosynthesis and repair protein YggX